MRAAVYAVLLAAAASPATAQHGDGPSRPKLPAQADTNDAEVYYQFARDRTTDFRDAYAAFVWANRIDPTQTHYLYARYQAEWARRPWEWRVFYNQGDKRVTESGEAQLLDSLYAEVVLRDPFPRLPMETCVVDRYITQVRNPWAQGLYWYYNGCNDRAADQWKLAIEMYPNFIGLRVDGARALGLDRKFAEAVDELTVVLDTMRQRDIEHLRFNYQSKAFLEYMLGVAHLGARRIRPAQEAFGRALVEDLGFYPAHVQLAELARRRRQHMSAAQEYEAALATEGTNVKIHYDYAMTLMDLNRFADAETHFRRALELEPHFALAYLRLGKALEAQAKNDEAVEAYRAYVARAPARLTTLKGDAEARIAALTGAT